MAGRFVAVGTTDTNDAITSDNGSDWTLQALDAPGADGRAVEWSPQLRTLCAVSRGSGPPAFTYFSTSTDGVTWTNSSSYTGNYDDIAWSSSLGLFCAVSIAGKARTSSDGITWSSESTLPYDPGGLYATVIWADELGLFICPAYNTTSGLARAATSPDGTTWTLRTFPSVSGAPALIDACWSPGLTLAVAVGFNISTANRIATSPDGVNWTWRSGANTSGWQFYGVTWSEPLGLFAAVGTGGGSGRIFTSPDGAAWTERTSPVATVLDAVAWSDELGLFCATSRQSSGSVGDPSAAISDDGVTWTAVSSGLLHPVRAQAVCAITLAAAGGIYRDGRVHAS